MRQKVFLTGILTLGAIMGFGQDTLSVSREDILSKVKESNYQMRVSELQAQMATSDYQQSNSLYLPQVSASYTAITTNNPLMAFGSKLNQEILTPADFDPTLLNDPDNVRNYATEILVLQPLLNLDGVYGRNAARIQKEAYQLKAERTREYLELEATKMYMQLQLAYEAVGVLEKAVITSNEAVSMVTDYFEQGLLQKADLLDVKVRAGEVQNQLRYAQSNVQTTSDQLAILMGEEPGAQVYQPIERSSTTFRISSTNMILPEGRKDLLAMAKSVEGYESMLKSTRMKFMPRINAFGSFQLYDNQFLAFDASGYVLGAKLSWDLFNGYSNIAKTTKARLQAEKAQVERDEYTAQQQAELNKANRMLVDAQNKVSLAELALEQSNEAYRTRKDRFEEGLETTTDLLASEAQMFRKELEYRQAIFEYNFTSEYLQFLTRQ